MKKKLKISDSLPPVFGKAEELNRTVRDLIRKVEDIIDLGNRLKVTDLLSFDKQ